jgi:hypothetical protein
MRCDRALLQTAMPALAISVSSGRRHVGGKRREDKIAVFQALDGCGSDDDIADLVRVRRIEAPVDHLAIRFSCTPFRSGESLEMKPGMIR